MAEGFCKPYTILFNAVTETIQALGSGHTAEARAALIRAQQDAEEAYINGGQSDTNMEISLNLTATVKQKLGKFGSDLASLREQIELAELRQSELVEEEKRLETMSIEQLLEMNRVLQESTADRLKALRRRLVAFYVFNDFNRRCIYEMVDELCDTMDINKLNTLLFQIKHTAPEDG